MSYRDLRSFTEMMRALGYSRLISMENFRNPNFPLVAEILVWLVQRFDPDADMPSEFGTEMDRVLLIRSVAQFMAVKANVKMNTKRLYQADGYAVREMLKATALLYSTLLSNDSQQQDSEERAMSAKAAASTISSKMHELKQVRNLVSQITSKGAKLYDLLGKEVDLGEVRSSSVARQIEINNVEGGLHQAIEFVRHEIADTKMKMENVSATESSMDNKIEKRKMELERNQKRLQTLKKVRPAFMEEFERLETELRQLYESYVLRFRCMTYLEQQYEAAEQAEQERMEERQAATKKLLEQLKLDDGSLKLIEGSGDLFTNQKVVPADDGIITQNGDDISKFAVSKRPSQADRNGVRTGGARPVTGRRNGTRVFGSMTGGKLDGDSGSLDSDSDLLLDGSELLGSEDDDDNDELEMDPAATADGGIRARTGHARKPPDRHYDHSDDDF